MSSENKMDITDTPGPIIFEDGPEQTKLVEDGEVVTFRPKERGTGKTWWKSTMIGSKEGDVVVERLEAVDTSNPDELEPYIEDTAYEAVAEWQEVIVEYRGYLPDGVVYRVTEWNDTHEGDE